MTSRSLQEEVHCSKCGISYSRRKRYHKERRDICRGCVISLGNFLRTGDKNPAWKGGHEYWQAGKLGRDKDGLSWKTQRRLAWDRDSYTCQDCGKTQEQLGCRPDVDHEIPYRISFSHALSNLKCRCRSCHKKIEATRTELWDGKTLGGGLGRKPKPSCTECGNKRRSLENGICLPCLRIQQKIPEAKRLFEKGMTYREIGERMGVSHVAVWLWFKKNKI